MDWNMVEIGVLAAAGLICVWFIIRGLIEMQRINAGDSDVVEVQGVVRQTRRSSAGVRAVVTLNVDDEVLHADCMLPRKWFSRRVARVTDVVTVLWHKRESYAVAVQTIRNGQRLFLIGILGLTLSVTLWAILF